MAVHRLVKFWWELRCSEDNVPRERLLVEALQTGEIDTIAVVGIEPPHESRLFLERV